MGNFVKFVDGILLIDIHGIRDYLKGRMWLITYAVLATALAVFLLSHHSNHITIEASYKQPVSETEVVGPTSVITEAIRYEPIFDQQGTLTEIKELEPITLGEGDQFTEEKVVDVIPKDPTVLQEKGAKLTDFSEFPPEELETADGLPLPTILYQKREKPDESWVINRPWWIKLLDTDHLLDGTLERFVTWKLGILQRIVIETVESPLGKQYIQVRWTNRGIDWQLEVPIGNVIKFSSCDETVSVRFLEDGMPEFLEGISEYEVYSLFVTSCEGSLNYQIQDTETKIPFGILNSERNRLLGTFQDPLGPCQEGSHCWALAE